MSGSPKSKGPEMLSPIEELHAALNSNFITRPLAANGGKPKWRLGGKAGSENRLLIYRFFNGQKNFLQKRNNTFLHFPSIENRDGIEMLHKRLSEAGETALF